MNKATSNEVLEYLNHLRDIKKSIFPPIKVDEQDGLYIVYNGI